MGRLLLVVLLIGCSAGETPRDEPRGSVEDGFLGDRGFAPDARRPDAGGDGSVDAMPSALDVGLVDAELLVDAAGDGAPDAATADVGPDAGRPACDAPLLQGPAELSFNGLNAGVAVEGPPCRRRFRLQSSAMLRDGVPENPRIIEESEVGPRLRSPGPLLDALYALAVTEAGENAVAAIQDGAFSRGQPLPCPPGGCYETGRLWHYVWTRDTAYAAALGLAALDPQRVQNSLEFKLSEPSSGGLEQIMQDTGTGGSHPISTDRVIWALGARALLPQLEGQRRAAFVRRAFAAMRATAEHDRAVAFDAEDGLYRGEQSFLDWREQSYPAWTGGHVAHIGMSKSLSTNIAHLILLELLANLGEELGEDGDWAQWAAPLRAAIRARFWLEEEGLFSTFITTTLDPAPARQFDLLGNALAVLEGLADREQARSIVSRYPHLLAGAPVIWPQQQFTPIYHNRAQWPFVTAFWLQAARQVGNDDVVAANAWVLARGAALNLSHMENFEAVSGLPFVEDGAYSGPVVNSQRQLWSVAAFLAFVHTAFFGIEPGEDGLRLAPVAPMALWTGFFGEGDRAVLENYPYRGRRVTLVVRRPVEGARPEPVFVPAAQVEDGMLIEVDSAEMRTGGPEGGQLIAGGEDYRTRFAPRAPRITGLEARADGLWLGFDFAGEEAAAVEVAIYRDGQRIAEGIQGDARGWLDADARAEGPSHCYSFETRFRGWDVWSQRAAPFCWWGPNGERVLSFGAERLSPLGGRRSEAHGRPHVEVWADQGQSLALEGFTVPQAGRWLVQAVYGNGAASVTTGVSCGLLRLRVLEEDGGREVGRGYLPLPHTGAWDVWRDSAFVAVDLVAGTRYRLVLDGEEHAYNMSIFQHFRRYTGGPGGEEGAFNRANISTIKLLGRL